jgi:hypothetical protein
VRDDRGARQQGTQPDGFGQCGGHDPRFAEGDGRGDTGRNGMGLHHALLDSPTGGVGVQPAARMGGRLAGRPFGTSS